MAFLNKFRCEVCGSVTGVPVLWLVVQSRESHLTILSWSAEAAHAPGAAHVCGEADAQIYLSRWLHSASVRSKAHTVHDAGLLRATVSDKPNRSSGRERRRTSGAVPIRVVQEEPVFQPG
jgi:hypothetical protein